MAVTNVHPIRSTLAKAVEYIINPDKTEKRLYVNSFGCSTDYEKAAEEFLKVRSLGSGKGNVLAQHIVQSFYGKEVTPEQAIQIGEELAEKFLKGKFQYIIATHIDKDNIHNHIIFNNISFEDFKSFEYTENRGGKSWENLRNASDELCREHGISVIENPQNNKGKCYYEWQQDSQGKSWKSKLRFAIDETIMESKSFDDFLDKIRAKNIECVYTPDKVIKIKFRMEGQERFTRGRTLGWYYDEPQIRKRIEQYLFLQSGVSKRKIHTKIIDTSGEVFQTSKGLLNWAEIKNMQEVSRLINFLSTQHIQSETELESKAVSTYNDRMIIVSTLNKTQGQIDDLSDRIKLLRAYKKYKHVYDGYKKSGASKKYKKENASAIEKYESVIKNLTELYPDKKLPSIESLERERTALIAQRAEMNETYKRIVQELKEIEFAKTSINEYLRNIDNSHRRTNGELE